MLYYARHSRLALTLAFVFTAITLLTVVALGWHYPLDCIGGGVVAALAIKIAHSQRHTLLPRVIGDEEDVALPGRRSGWNARVEPRGQALQ